MLENSNPEQKREEIQRKMNSHAQGFSFVYIVVTLNNLVFNNRFDIYNFFRWLLVRNLNPFEFY